MGIPEHLGCNQSSAASNLEEAGSIHPDSWVSKVYLKKYDYQEITQVKASLCTHPPISSSSSGDGPLL